LSIFQEKACGGNAEAGVESGFPAENAIMQKIQR
jgi:hypothetical protein